MKNNNFFGKRGFAVFTALALCASLVAPSFAASFSDLQEAINGKYEGTAFDITDDENGRTIKLMEDVEHEQADGSGAIGTNQAVVNTITVDLGGYNIDGKGEVERVLWARNSVDLTIRDSGREDAEGNTVFGAISGGSGFGAVASNSSKLTLESGAVDGGVWVAGTNATFTMKDGSVSGDVKADGANAFFKMEGGSLSGNILPNSDHAEVSGGTLSTQVDKGFLAENHDFVDNQDGTYDVVDHTTHRWGDWETVAEPQAGIDGVQERHCQVMGCTETDREAIPALVEVPEFEPVVVIDEPAVPLASGPVTQGEFVDYLWRHEDEPEGEPNAEPIVADDHEYAPAINWAQSIGIISAETFEADELVTVALVRDILTQFALYTDMAMPELTTLSGEDDEAVLNCDEILAEFFGEDAAE